MTGLLVCCQSEGFETTWSRITIWWRPLLKSLLTLFSQTSRIELLASEESGDWPFETSDGGGLLLNVGVASMTLLPTIWALRYQTMSRKLTR